MNVAVGYELLRLVSLAARSQSPRIGAAQDGAGDCLPRGCRPLIESILEVLDARGIKADLSEVMTTSGSQQGLDLTARVLIAPGDVVLVEVPTYTGAIAAFRNAQCRLAGVKQDPDGINLEDLDATLMRERAAGARVNLLYLVPNFQNPAGILLGLEKRARLLAWAERRSILIIED